MNTYCGPDGYGASPESGGSVEDGENRTQSLKRSTERLTQSVKNRISREFELYGAEVKQIVKTAKGYIRVSYNGDLFK